MENRISFANAGGVEYFYDAQNKRVWQATCIPGYCTPGGANDQVKFATYTRDSATGNDYADQRYYTSVLGRFMTPDPYRASGGPSSPQSWNRYTYVAGDPVNRMDPNGNNYVCVGPSDDLTCFDDGSGDGGDGGGGSHGGGGGSDSPTVTGKEPVPAWNVNTTNQVAITFGPVTVRPYFGGKLVGQQLGGWGPTYTSQ